MIYVLLELHDFSFFKHQVLEKILDYFPKGLKLNIAITPYFNNKLDINKLKELIDLYKDNFNCEFGLHGYYHEYYEFKKISQEEAEIRINKGINLLKSLGVQPKFFIPPHWALNKENEMVVKKYFDLYSTLNFIKYKNKSILSPLIIYGFGDILNLVDYLISKGFKYIHFIITNFLFNSFLRIVFHPSILIKEDIIDLLEFLKILKVKYLHYSEIPEKIEVNHPYIKRE